MRLLVVEEQRSVAEAIVRTLTEHDYEVDVAGDGETGLRKAGELAYDLIVVDLRLHLIRGTSWYRQLRTRQPQAPVVLMTTRAVLDDDADGLDDDLASFLVIPFAPFELVGQVRALLRRARRLGELTMQVGDLTIDVVNHVVSRGGEPVHLSAKEYAILKLLARNPNRVMTREQIAQGVWGFESGATSNIVDVYMGYLRRKLGDRPERRLIYTVRGLGYQLRAPAT